MVFHGSRIEITMVFPHGVDPLRFPELSPHEIEHRAPDPHPGVN